MSDSLALSITVPLSQLPRLVASFSSHLEPDSVFTEESLATSCAGGSHLSISLRFPPDAALEAFRAEYPDIQCSMAGQIAIGDLFVSTRIVPRGMEVSVFTSSRALVRVLKESGQVRAFFLGLAVLADPQEVRVTDEWNETSILSAIP